MALCWDLALPPWTYKEEQQAYIEENQLSRVAEIVVRAFPLRTNAMFNPSGG